MSESVVSESVVSESVGSSQYWVTTRSLKSRGFKARARYEWWWFCKSELQEILSQYYLSTSSVLAPMPAVPVWNQGLFVLFCQEWVGNFVRVFVPRRQGANASSLHSPHRYHSSVSKPVNPSQSFCRRTDRCTCCTCWRLLQFHYLLLLRSNPGAIYWKDCTELVLYCHRNVLVLSQ